MNTEFTALHRLNAANQSSAEADFLRCCGASKWVLAMMNARPFADAETLFESSERAFDTLEKMDWLEAFAHHPKIGDIGSLRSKFAATREWAGDEQAGTGAANEATLRDLALGNSDYEKKFGFIFIICATGKSAGEMLVALQARLSNTGETEIGNAAEQQKRITRLRLRKLLES